MKTPYYVCSLGSLRSIHRYIRHVAVLLFSPAANSTTLKIINMLRREEINFMLSRMSRRPKNATPIGHYANNINKQPCFSAHSRIYFRLAQIS